MSNLEITDHALLRWMERVHGVDVETWRALMQAEIEDSLSAYEGRADTSVPEFVIQNGRVVTCIGPGHRIKEQRRPGAVCVPRVA